MDCANNQCCAVSFDNTRCKNSVVDGSNHCELHRPKAVQLYKAYKKPSDIAEKLDLDKSFKNITDHINYIMRCYVILNKTLHTVLLYKFQQEYYMI